MKSTGGLGGWDVLASEPAYQQCFNLSRSRSNFSVAEGKVPHLAGGVQFTEGWAPEVVLWAVFSRIQRCPPKLGFPVPDLSDVASQQALEVSSCRVGDAEALQDGRKRRGYLVQALRNFETLTLEWEASLWQLLPRQPEMV